MEWRLTRRKTPRVERRVYVHVTIVLTGLTPPKQIPRGIWVLKS